MPIDDRALGELIQQSEDLHSDSVKATRQSLSEMVEVGHHQRAGRGVDPAAGPQSAEVSRQAVTKALVAGGALAAAAFGPALLGLIGSTL